MPQPVSVKRGDRFARKDPQACALGVVRVMTVAEGWAMVRFPRAVPFAVFVKDLLDESQFVRVEDAP